MRITGGSLRGRKIKTPHGPHVEPVPDRVRESLFSILQHVVPDSRVLDLFACSGSLGIEALSRDAQYVLFVEKNSPAANVISENLESLGITGNARIITGSAFNAISLLINSNDKFDLAFIDPPYPLSENPDSFKLIEQLIVSLFTETLKPEGIVVFRQRKGSKNPLSGHAGFKLDTRTYGTTQVTLIERPGK